MVALKPLVPLQVRRYVVARHPGIATRLKPTDERVPSDPTVGTIFAETFPLLRPLSVYPTAMSAPPRLTLITDSVNRGSLFGGVGTSLILSAMLACRLGTSLRVVTRTEQPDPSGFATVLGAHGVSWDDNVEFLYSPLTGGAAIPWDRHDLALTTSWWSTWAALRSVDPKRIVYLLQEDERLFYPAGDEQLLCSEVLADERITFVVNTPMLYQHLLEEGFDNLLTRGMPFEPAFPENIYFRAPRLPGDRKRFFFYARPANFRNLFVRGIASINEALGRGILDPDEWEFLFVGRGIPPVSLANGVVPTRAEDLPWPAYAELIRSVDLGLSLVATPHPSYPPLDLAACGAIALTNRWGPKGDLSGYSANILSVNLGVEQLVGGIAQAVKLASDAPQRMSNYRSQNLSRSWETSFAPVIERLAREL
jgi:hypothetical protein